MEASVFRLLPYMQLMPPALGSASEARSFTTTATLRLSDDDALCLLMLISSGYASNKSTSWKGKASNGRT